RLVDDQRRQHVEGAVRAHEDDVAIDGGRDCLVERVERTGRRGVDHERTLRERGTDEEETREDLDLHGWFLRKTGASARHAARLACKRQLPCAPSSGGCPSALPAG